MGFPRLRGIALLGGGCLLAAGAGHGVGLLQRALEEPASTAVADAGSPAAAGGDFQGSQFVEIGQVMVPVMDGGRTTAFILVQLTLEAPDGTRAALLREHFHHIRNDLLQSLFGQAGAGVFDGRAVDPGAVAETLRRDVNRRLGGEPVKAVLIDRLLRQDNSRS